MTAEEWAEVFEAGFKAISGIGMQREEALPESLYGAAAIARALDAMNLKCREIAARATS